MVCCHYENNGKFVSNICGKFGTLIEFILVLSDWCRLLSLSTFAQSAIQD